MGLIEDRLPLFPCTTTVRQVASEQRLFIGGCDLAGLADKFGTPLYVYDRDTLDKLAGEYRDALKESYPGESGITYAGKAFFCLAIAQWALAQGFRLDCTGAGEIHIARAAGAPREAILVHGVSKTREDLQAVMQHAGTLVVDNLDELQSAATLIASSNLAPPDLWLRFRPGISVTTHDYTKTGQADSKFGMSHDEIVEALRFCHDRNLPLTGLHFHQGSHFHDPAPLVPAIDAALDLAVAVHQMGMQWPQTLCTGGGWGLAYHEADLPHPPIAAYVRFIAEKVVAGCRERRLELPVLQLEPGRSLVAQAGVAIYQVNGVKRTPHRRWLLVNGGLADNPRPALYGARYTALPVSHPERPSNGPAWLGGPYCESGDVLISGLDMPEMSTGELVAVPVSGAYQLSMSSNYNGARRPAVVWLENGNAHLIQRRETIDDLLDRDLPLII